MQPGYAHVPGGCKRVAPVLARVGDKWTVLVVMLLDRGPMRFNAMKRAIDGISQRMLTLTLRGLERDGFVRRTVYPTNPPRVDYDLTDLGRSLLVPIRHLGQWAFENTHRIEAAQAAYDGAEAAPSAA